MNSLLALVLLAQVPHQPFGVQPTPELERLGRKLFFDPILSADGTVSCASCHDPNKGWADGRATAIGIRGQVGNMNSPSILNRAFFREQFWNGRTFGHGTQALQPLENAIEMGPRGNEAAAVVRLRNDSEYVKLFANALGTQPTAIGLATSIAVFENTIVSKDCLATRRANGRRVLSPDAEVGYNLFTGIARCSTCHKPPLWTDFGYHNNGVMHGRTIGPQGRIEVTRLRADRRKWKTQPLIGLKHTAPYMHDGSLPTIRSVLEHYNLGGVRNGRVDANTEIRPLGLTSTQLDYLEKFVIEGFEPMETPR